MIDENKLIEDLLHNDRMNFTVKLDPSTAEGVGVFVREYTAKMKEGFIDLINAQPKILFGVDLAKREEVWTPCKEHQPKKTDRYLVTCRGLHKPQIRLFDGTWDSVAEVIAWKPLPETYKGEF